MNTITSLTAQQLRHAAGLKEKIAALEKQLSQILGSTSDVKPSAPAGRKKMSAAARKKIGAAQKARWAKVKGKNSAKPAANPIKKAKRKVSAAARARLSQLAKARWAKAKAAGKNTL